MQTTLASPSLTPSRLVDDSVEVKTSSNDVQLVVMVVRMLKKRVRGHWI